MRTRLVVSIVAAIAALGVRADEWEDPVTHYTWTYKINGGTAEICNDDEPAVYPSPVGALVIPAMLGGVPVVSIGYKAFCECTDLTSVTMPDGVTSIGDEAFSGCSSLAEVSIGAGVVSIGWDVFLGCDETLFDTTTFPGLKLVDGWVVGYTGDLPDDLNLADARGIAPEAFRGSAVKKVIIGSGVKSIGSWAFHECASLTNVTIGANVIKIGYEVFEGCDDSLYDTTSFIGLKLVDGWVVGYTDDLPGDLNLAGVRGVSEGAFLYCDRPTSVTIPEGMKIIGDGAFENFTGLTSVTMPSSLEVVGNWAFCACSALREVVVPDKVTTIGMEAFLGCTSLTNAVLGTSVTRIGERAFYDCDELSVVRVPVGYHLEEGVFPDTEVLEWYAPSEFVVDVGGGKSVTVPGDWVTKHTSRSVTDNAANGRPVWQCYVLGLDPEGSEDFRITSFPMNADGTPNLAGIEFSPVPNRWNVSGATARLKGRASLESGEWQEVANPSAPDPALRFFKVEVVLP